MNDNCPVMFTDLLKQGGISSDRLQRFCVVARAGGVTLTAKGDPTKQSLFSRQIKELEEFFGVDAGRPRGRGIALTLAGEQLPPATKPKLLSAELPLATLEGGGRFRQVLARPYEHHRMKLDIQMESSSLPLVARAVQTGGFDPGPHHSHV
jgi:DNA-binding transcriptional LysR family regulator